MRKMTFSWIAAAERNFPAIREGMLGTMMRLLDGSSNWRPISTAPFNHVVELRVADELGISVIPFPCRQTARGWVNADLGARLDTEPSEWRTWPDKHLVASNVSPSALSRSVSHRARRVRQHVIATSETKPVR
jgi:hypothetical protein